MWCACETDVWAWIDWIHRVCYVLSGYPRNPIKASLILLIEFADTLIISLYSFYGLEWLYCQYLLIQGITFPGSDIMLFIKTNKQKPQTLDNPNGLQIFVLSHLANSWQETSLCFRDWALFPNTNRIGMKGDGIIWLWYIKNNLAFIHMKGHL